VESGDSIHDIIKFVRSTVPIYMIGTGWVASAGALIYLAGEKKTRFCLPNTRFLLHQPMGGARGPATDIEARELIKMHERLVQIIATETGQSVERVRKDTDRNYWMSASEAIDYGLANKIISSIKGLLPFPSPSTSAVESSVVGDRLLPAATAAMERRAAAVESPVELTPSPRALLLRRTNLQMARKSSARHPLPMSVDSGAADTNAVRASS
jgi:hypothetical protein